MLRVHASQLAIWSPCIWVESTVYCTITICSIILSCILVFLEEVGRFEQRGPIILVFQNALRNFQRCAKKITRKTNSYR